eukprot:TRINITY_DN15852_c0_g1_i1.p1 TRINITY_DN15852_c0_g1~~TRINITY_DN15852_c0_g1_i1.p1  ORF type:complete len:434 (+),score=66.24 TRINITY_DN15852_c0_g1_i1:67-1368(+)
MTFFLRNITRLNVTSISSINNLKSNTLFSSLNFMKNKYNFSTKNNNVVFEEKDPLDVLFIKPNLKKVQDIGSVNWKWSDKVKKTATVEDSITTKILNLTNEDLKTEYLSFTGNIRIGKLLEELDAIAGLVAYKHTDGLNPKNPVTIVTASCDQIVQFDEPRVSNELKITGRLTHTGSSSMEILVEVDQRDPKVENSNFEKVLKGYFVMVSRHVTENKAVKVPILVVRTEEEKKLWDRGERNKKLRIKNSTDSLTSKPPTKEELDFIHQTLYINNVNDDGINDNDSVPISNTNIGATKIMHPIYKNIHGKVFGGYLMRTAFELAYLTTSLYVKQSIIKFISMDDITFKTPVPLGSILDYKCCVIHCDSDSKLLHVVVKADVINPQTSTRLNTNDFYFTFKSENSFRPVIPVTYHEAVQHLIGRRIHNSQINRTD